MTLTSVANRGFNLLAASVLGLGGLVFGSVFFQEQDWSDKVDDGGFLFIAGTALAWYVWRENRFCRSPAPVAVAVLAVVIQIAGLVLERDDPKAFGDNIGGTVYFVAATVLLVVQYRTTRRITGPVPLRSSILPTRSKR